MFERDDRKSKLKFIYNDDIAAVRKEKYDEGIGEM